MAKVKLGLVGKKITDVRPATQEEMDFEHWDQGFYVIELDDDTLLYASIDDEGNGPGSLFGRNKSAPDKESQGFTIME